MHFLIFVTFMFCTTISFGQEQQFNLVHSGLLDSASVSISDTSASGNSAYRFFMTTQEITGTRYMQWTKKYSLHQIPDSGIIVKIYTPQWNSGATRIALTCISETTIVNSALDTLVPGNDYTSYRFRFPQVNGVFDSLQFSFSYFSGESGTRVIFVDDITLLYQTGSFPLDLGGDIDTIAPDPPTLTMTETTATHIRIHVIASSDSDYAGARLLISRDVNFIADSLVRVVLLGAGDTLQSIVDSLMSGTAYFVKGQSFDVWGNYGEYSPIIFTTTFPSPPVDTISPGPPKVFGSGTGKYTANIMVIAPSDSGTNRVKVLYDNTVNFLAADTVWFTVVPSETLHCALQDLSPSTMFYTKGFAYDHTGNMSSQSLIDTFLTWSEPVIDSLPPGKPILSAAGTSAHAITLSIIATSEGDVQKVHVKSSLDVNFTDSTIHIFDILPSETLRVIYDSIPSNTNMYFKGRLLDSAGNMGMYSLITVGTTLVSPPIDTLPPGSPQNFVAFATGSHQVTVRYQNPLDTDLDSGVVIFATNPNFTNAERKYGTNLTPGGLNTVVFDNIPSTTLCFVRGYMVDSAGHSSIWTLIDTAFTWQEHDSVPPTPPLATLFIAASTELRFRLVNSSDQDLDTVSIMLADNPNFVNSRTEYGMSVAAGDTNILIFENLAVFTTYYGKTYARDSAGNVAWSEVFTVHTVRDSLAPLPPFNIEGVGASSQSVCVVFQHAINPDIDTTVFFLSSDPNFLQNVFVKKKIHPIPGLWDTLFFVGLIPHTLYYLYGESWDISGNHSNPTLVDTAITWFVTGISEIHDVPHQFTLYQNYPNPFNPTTTIAFDVPQDATINLVVYNAIGEEVFHILRDVEYAAGSHTVTLDASSLTSGIYFYRLISRDVVMMRKMVVIK